MRVVLDIISGDKKTNDFMHYCDMFESFKQLGEHQCLVVTGEPDLENLTMNTKRALEEGGQNVVFVSIRQIDEALTNDYEQYIKPGTASISDGKKWGMFKGCLEQLGYEVETNSMMQVEKVKLVC
jgi:hypothetical protein